MRGSEQKIRVQRSACEYFLYLYKKEGVLPFDLDFFPNALLALSIKGPRGFHECQVINTDDLNSFLRLNGSCVLKKKAPTKGGEVSNSIYELDSNL
jgi:hypothetical protein